MFCDKCEKELKTKEVEGALEIEGGKWLVYKNGDTKYELPRCDECYEKDKTLQNYQPCEVYSRCCGYYRPVQQYNKGVRQQYDERKEFVEPKTTP